MGILELCGRRDLRKDSNNKKKQHEMQHTRDPENHVESMMYSMLVIAVVGYEVVDPLMVIDYSIVHL